MSQFFKRFRKFAPYYFFALNISKWSPILMPLIKIPHAYMYLIQLTFLLTPPSLPSYKNRTMSFKSLRIAVEMRSADLFCRFKNLNSLVSTLKLFVEEKVDSCTLIYNFASKQAILISRHWIKFQNSYTQNSCVYGQRSILKICNQSLCLDGSTSKDFRKGNNSKLDIAIPHILCHRFHLRITTCPQNLNEIDEKQARY